MSGVNTRDCPELYSKREMNSVDQEEIAGQVDSENCEYEEENDSENTIRNLRDRFPLCTLKMIQDTLRRKTYDSALAYLTVKHDELQKQNSAKMKKNSNPKKFEFQTESFPKLSAEREWELIDDLEDWEKLDPIQKSQKTWAEKLKENAN